MSNLASSPCKECGQRKVGCHIDCEKYHAFTKVREELRRIRQAEWEVRDVHARSVFDRRHSLGKRITGKSHVIGQN